MYDMSYLDGQTGLEHEEYMGDLERWQDEGIELSTLV